MKINTGSWCFIVVEWTIMDNFGEQGFIELWWIMSSPLMGHKLHNRGIQPLLNRHIVQKVKKSWFESHLAMAEARMKSVNDGLIMMVNYYRNLAFFCLGNWWRLTRQNMPQWLVTTVANRAIAVWLIGRSFCLLRMVHKLSSSHLREMIDLENVAKDIHATYDTWCVLCEFDWCVCGLNFLPIPTPLATAVSATCPGRCERRPRTTKWIPTRESGPWMAMSHGRDEWWERWRHPWSWTPGWQTGSKL